MTMDGREHWVRSASEQEMLKALRDYVLLEQGFFWHVRDARGQDLIGLPDIVAILPPRPGRMPGVLACFELKSQHDRISPVQHKVIRMIGQATEIVSGIVRPTPRTLAEIDLDDALALLGREER